MARTPTVTLRLAARPPFDWAGLAEFLAARAIPGIEAAKDGVYRRTLMVDRLPGLVVVQGEGDGIVAKVRGPAAARADAVAARLRRLFDLDADVDGIRAALGADPVLAPALARRPGLRVPGAWEGFELGIRAVLGQQVTVAGASTLAGRLVAAHGAPLPADLSQPGLTHLFPEPARLAATDLSSIGLPRVRARTLSSLAAAAEADPALFEATGDLDADLARLDALPGIGPWSANYIAMRALRHGDAFPTGDLGLLRAIAGDGPLPSHASLSARAEAWRPWRAYAALHLWTGLDPGPRPARKPR
jgi:AraC family transcriptional regulator of adaptative response / DNA-3-methyladenine glycosylase II